MDEYIKREDALEITKRTSGDYATAFSEICKIPTVDVTPVRHGRWICIRKRYGEYECSVCRGVDSNCSDYYGTHVVTEQEYCPNCGAKMDGGMNNEIYG